jgi:hypothetical protein
LAGSIVGCLMDHTVTKKVVSVFVRFRAPSIIVPLHLLKHTLKVTYGKDY